MKQQSLASQVGFEKYGRKSRREQFLDEMEQVVPWSRLQALGVPHYAKAGIYKLRTEADNHSRDLYGNNKEVYKLLRCGVQDCARICL